ncbi:MAG: N-acetylneuraminate synthase family protein [Candidatus Adiutrix sp.]|jgi:sialic acid synthase SpsE|nr:N-acetylneuraminate synthase family protein [Candidatus Adiutrix sp.]
MTGFHEIQVGDRLLGPGRPALLVAEIGGNHGGDPALAEILVRAAARAGAGAVKFQAYRARSFLSPLSPYYRDLAAEELPFATLAALVRLGQSLGLAAGLTVFDEEGLALAETAGADFLKISSGDLTHHRLLARAAEAGRPLFLSTGAGEEAEVEAALAVLAPVRERLVVLQCTALYPAPPVSANLAVLARRLGCGPAAGYSDHVPGLDASRLALSLGALVLEKHFTTDRSRPGGDNALSATPEEFRQLADWAEEVVLLTGSPVKRVQPGEEAVRPLIRRALVLTRDRPAGAGLTSADLALKRPPAAGPGLLGPDQLEPVLGRVLKRALAEGAALTKDDLADA